MQTLTSYPEQLQEAAQAAAAAVTVFSDLMKNGNAQSAIQNSKELGQDIARLKVLCGICISANKQIKGGSKEMSPVNASATSSTATRDAGIEEAAAEETTGTEGGSGDGAATGSDTNTAEKEKPVQGKPRIIPKKSETRLEEQAQHLMTLVEQPPRTELKTKRKSRRS
jgi:hypothetical protein